MLAGVGQPQPSGSTMALTKQLPSLLGVLKICWLVYQKQQDLVNSRYHEQDKAIQAYSAGSQPQETLQPPISSIPPPQNPPILPPTSDSPPSSPPLSQTSPPLSPPVTSGLFLHMFVLCDCSWCQKKPTPVEQDLRDMIIHPESLVANV